MSETSKSFWNIVLENWTVGDIHDLAAQAKEEDEHHLFSEDLVRRVRHYTKES